MVRADGDFWRFLRRVLSASRVLHVSDLHSKFALRPHHCVQVWQTSNLRPLKLCEEKRKKKKEETTGQKYNGLPYSTGRP